MGCVSCSPVGEGGIAQGCNNNGNCSTGGCNKLNVFDWLSDMDASLTGGFDVVEVRFKNGRKEFFRNSHGLKLYTGDAVVVDVPNGHHIGHVSLQGELVRLQMKKRGVENNDALRAIYRTASQKDIEKHRDAKKREMPTLYRAKHIIQDLGLKMKLTDVEFQTDNTKAIFYYSADNRIDFRELIKILATEFKVRIEMRQIGMRQEAGRLGGIGSCGRELCCSTWLGDFKFVSTVAVRYQNLSLNPGKLSGQCGRLKCCLNYELDTYMDALQDIPHVQKPLETQKGRATLQKTDIFRKVMWFCFDKENNWHPVPVSRVKEIQALNKKGGKPASLTENVEEGPSVGRGVNNDLVAMDKRFAKSNKKKRQAQKRKSNKPNNKP